MKPQVHSFFDPATWTLTYIVFDSTTKDAILIDPVWDYDPAASKLSTQNFENHLKYLKDNQLKLHYIIETHAHADHVTASQLFKKEFPNAKLAVSERIQEVQKTFRGIYNFGSEFDVTGKQFDVLIKDHTTLKAGSLEVQILPTPGHTPACTSFLIGDAVFTGDALFNPDNGTGRCDFPGGSAESLFQSIKQQLYTLPDSTRLYPGHDYPPATRQIRTDATIGESKKSNTQIKAETTLDEYVTFRKNRDKTLAAPRLLLPSIQMNIQGGHLPPAENNGGHYLKIPIR